MNAVGWLHAHLLLDKIKILLIVLLSFFSSPWPISPCNVSQAWELSFPLPPILTFPFLGYMVVLSSCFSMLPLFPSWLF